MELDWARLAGQTFTLIAISYAILAVFLIKPLARYRTFGAGLAIACAAGLAYAASTIAGSEAWLAWLMTTAFIVWRASRKTRLPEKGEAQQPPAVPSRVSLATRALRGSVWLAAFFVAFFGVKYAKQVWFDERAIAKVSADLDQMRADATKARPDLPASQAYQQAASKQATTKLANQAGDKQAETAADMYWGFLFVNTRARVAFCRNLGIDISSFATAFERLHAAETAQAHAIYRRLSSVTEDDLYQKLKSQMLKTVGDDMTGVAKASNVSTTAVCQAFSSEGEEIAKEMLLSKTQPAIYEALKSAR